MSNKFVGFLETVGKDIVKGLGFAVKEAPAASALAAILFPPSAAISPFIVAGLNLVQSSIISIEQKYAASGVQTGSGVQKASEVLTLTGPAVSQLLSAAGVPNVTDAYVQTLITAIVSVLNALPPTAVPAA